MTENFAFKDPTWFAAFVLIASVVALRFFRRQRVLIVPFSARWQSSASHGSREAVATSAALVDALPSSLRPDRRGVDVLITHRQRLGLRGGTESYDSVVDTSLVDARAG